MRRIIILLSMALLAVGVFAQTKILVMGVKHNVSSNYYPNIMISEETGIPTDSIDATYNNAIANNIIENFHSKHYEFIVSDDESMEARVVNSIKVTGEKEKMYVDLSNLDVDSYQKLLDETGADYMLFISQHYLRWQETPMRTLFHFISYSLVDKDCNKVYDGTKNFSSMNLLTVDQLCKMSKKSSIKIAMAAVDEIDQ